MEAKFLTVEEGKHKYGKTGRDSNETCNVNWNYKYQCNLMVFSIRP